MNLLNHDNIWQASNLPDGLSFENGVISGNPKSRGVFDVHITVSNQLGSSSKNIRIKCRYRADVTIVKDGAEFEIITLPELQAAIQNGTAQSKYNCIDTQMLIPVIHPITSAITYDVPVNFCSFRNVTLADGAVKPGLILQFSHTLWKGLAPFGTNNFNRWRYSQLRKWLNSSGMGWFSSSYNDDIITPHEGSYSESICNGFLSCLPTPLLEVISPVKVVTQAFFDDENEDTSIDDPEYVNGIDCDITYDKIFIPALSEMNIDGSDDTFPDDGFEGDAWEFYSALSSGSLICKDFNGSPCSVITRSAVVNGKDKIFCVDNTLQPIVSNVYNAEASPAPTFVIC
mgnify:CR=1 FL=1